MPKRLLLVDDRPQNLAQLEWMLAPLGHELVRAEDGPSALDAFVSCRPDLVLLDLVMPGMDGFEVLERIRRRTQDSYVPVIVLTAHSERELRLRGLEAGADDFLEKPPDREILRARVTTLLELKHSRDLLRDLNSALESRNEALERSHREQRELTAFIVHDLKTPLSVVWSHLEFARKHLAPDNEPLGRDLDAASQGARRLRAMIEDLLIISRLEECRLSLRPETVVLSGLLREVSGSFGRRAAEKSVRLTVSRRTRARVTADRSLLQRVIENILDNSLRHTPRHGRVAISMRVDDAVEIAFSNTGPAIPVSDRRRIFEKFARLDGPTVPGNAGLGLYFCKRAVEALGGAIEVRETSQWPTSFVVRLPWAARALIETVTADVPTSDRGTIEQKKDGPRALRHGARFSRVPLSRGRRAR